MAASVRLETGWGAVDFLGMAAQGRTTPFFVNAWKYAPTKAHDLRFYSRNHLVKAAGNPDLMAREIYGNLIARTFGLTTPQPTVVFVPEEILNPARAQLMTSGRWLNATAGESAGCYQVPLSSNVPILDELRQHLDQALQLFVFDMLAQNADRTPANPNCAEVNDDLLVFDFEQCFVLDGAKMTDGHPWTPCRRGLHNFHFCKPFLAGTNPSKVELQKGIKRLTESRLDKMLNSLPGSWQPEAARVKAHILAVRENLGEFTEDLQWGLR